jgi:hypothetical protein
LQHQVSKFLIRWNKNEIRRESIKVSIHLLVQSCRLNAVKRGEIGIEQNALASNTRDPSDDVLQLDRTSVRHG